LKKQLYNLFSEFGAIIDVIASRAVRCRGQAWIVFSDIATATAAIRKMNGQIFHDKPMKISYARAKSDAIAKLDGTYFDQKKQRDEKRKQAEEKRKRELGDEGERPAKRQRIKAKGSKADVLADRNMSLNEPNKILFIENLPSDIAQSNDRQTFEMLFKNYNGYKEARFIPGKTIAFVEYDTEVNASNAMAELQGYKFSKQPIKITFARK
jgi:U2 small nuclear ribonucleoprotein B''